MGLLAKICGCGVRTALDQQREAMRRELSELASQLGVHGSALAELFRLELGEYMRRQRRRMGKRRRGNSLCRRKDALYLRL